MQACSLEAVSADAIAGVWWLRRTGWSLHRAIVALLLSGIFVGVSNNVSAVDQDAAASFVKQTTEKLVAEIGPKAKAFEAQPASVFDIVERLMSDHLDMPRMARWILGKHWASATAEQQNAFLDEFRKIIVRTYSRPFVDYLTRPLSYLPARPRAEDDVSVPIMVTMTNGPSVSVQFDMHPEGSGWKIHDVSVDGVSLVASYRTSYSAMANKSGMDGLIGKMRELNARFTG